MKYLLTLIFLFSFVSSALAAGTTTSRPMVNDTNSSQVTSVEWTAEADGSFTDYTISGVCGWISPIVTVPGSTAPTALYDITLTDTDGVDIAGGELLNRSASSPQQIMPAVGNSYGPRPVCGDLTLSISNNSVASATGKVIIYAAN